MFPKAKFPFDSKVSEKRFPVAIDILFNEFAQANKKLRPIPDEIRAKITRVWCGKFDASDGNFGREFWTQVAHIFDLDFMQFAQFVASLRLVAETADSITVSYNSVLSANAIDRLLAGQDPERTIHQYPSDLMAARLLAGDAS